MKKRILHVVYNLERGGIQNWLMNVLRYVNPLEYQIDIMIFRHTPSPYIKELERLGIKIIFCNGHRNIFLFFSNFIRIVNKKNYDAIHSHTSYHSGLELMLAWIAGIKIRISQVHSDLSKVPCNSYLRKFYQYLMRFLVNKFATMVADSQPYGISFYGRKWLSSDKSTVINCGLDFSVFKKNVNRSQIRKSLSITENKKIIGHVGRFSYPKNHKLILEIFSLLLKRRDDIILVLVGEGELFEELITYANALNINDKTIFTGDRNDVPEILMGVFDIFLFPSHYEGAALAVIEAMAAGLPCVISSVIANESRVIPELIHPISLNCPAEIWVSKIEKLLDSENKFPQEKASELIMKSPFAIEKSVESILRLYK